MKDPRGVRAGTGPTMSPMSAVAGGLVAGAVGTLAMDLLLFRRHRAGGGRSPFLHWEFSAVEGWGQAPAPAQVGKRLVEGLFRRELPDQRAGLVNNATHWGYGVLAGVQYGIVAGSLTAPKVRNGLLLGTLLWGTSYVILPAAGLYQPIWEYDRRTLARDLSAHLVYGLSTAAAFDLVRRAAPLDAPARR
jgi:hypothetical protein